MPRPPARTDPKQKQGLVPDLSHASRYLRASLLLHQHLVRSHWTGKALIGPDPGIRFGYRIGRFIKSSSSWIRWRDDLCYLQAQAYWVLANWRLFSLSGEPVYRDIAIACSDEMLDRQRPDGAWDYPNREWRGRVATTEGIWTSIGLLETYRNTNNRDCLDGVRKWFLYLTDQIGFQGDADNLSINYFADHRRGRVVNVSVEMLRLGAELHNATGDYRLNATSSGLLNFIEQSQKETGELPYAISSAEQSSGGRPHFQCFQYNAFCLISLARYYELTEDPQSLSILSGLVGFVSSGLGHDGRAYYDCHAGHRFVIYHAAAVGAALFKARELGLHVEQETVERAYGFILSRQQENGSFPYSHGDYGFLSDRRSYPRYLAMILTHLLFASPSPLRNA